MLSQNLTFESLDVEFRIVIVGAGEGGFRCRIKFLILDAENDFRRYPRAVLDAAGLRIFIVIETGLEAGTAADEDLIPVCDEHAYFCRSGNHTVFAVLMSLSIPNFILILLYIVSGG